MLGVSQQCSGGDDDGGTNFDPHFRYLVSPNALTLFSSLPSISLLGTTIGGRYCHCYMHGRGGGDCRSPLYSTHSHTIIPLPSSLSKSIQTERSRLFSRGIFHYDQTFTRVIIMDLPSLPSHLFCPISLSTRCCNKESHLQQRRSLHVLHVSPTYQSTYPIFTLPFPFNFAAGRPTHCDCEPRLAADCSVTHDTPLFLLFLPPTNGRTDHGRRGASEINESERRGEINLIKRDFISTDFLANV